MDRLNRDNDYISKINQFVDGELPPDETTELFYAIADDPALQEEFTQSLVLQNMLKQDMIAPPAYLKDKLIVKFNLKKTAFLGTISFAILAFLRRYLMNPIAGGIVFGGLMFLIGYFINPERENNQISKIANQTQIIQNSTAPIVSSIASENTNTISTHKSIALLNKVQSKNRLVEPFDIGGDDDRSDYLFNEDTTPDEFVPLPRAIYSSQGDFNKSNILLNNNPDFIGNRKNPYNFYNFLENISISFNKNFISPNIKSNLDPLSNPMLNNFSLNIAYNINPMNSLSIEYGQENFTQKFSGKIDGNDAKIIQVYTAQYAGIGYYHYFAHIPSIYKANPYTKIFAGATQVGGLGKVEAGLNYSLNEKMAIRGGFETSLLLYKFQSQIFNSLNYGFTGGLSISFR